VLFVQAVSTSFPHFSVNCHLIPAPKHSKESSLAKVTKELCFGSSYNRVSFSFHLLEEPHKTNHSFLLVRVIKMERKETPKYLLLCFGFHQNSLVLKI
jgi:hypothetical protein